MPLFSMETLRKQISFEAAWERVVAAGHDLPKDKHLAPRKVTYDWAKTWMEGLRHVALKHDGGLSLLESYIDFRKTVGGRRRPDPTRMQWIYLYSLVGERHRRIGPWEIGFLVGRRDAFFPFVDSIPDKAIWDCYQRFLKEPSHENVATKSDTAEKVSPIRYPGLESAILEDAPAKVSITKIMCRDVTDEVILSRAIELEKGAVVASLIQEAPVDRIVDILITAHTNWVNPAPLFDHILAQREDDIAAWRDPWGNGFFWYLYRRPMPSMYIFRALPPKIRATFETENRYGISPKDIWIFYRPPQQL